MNGVVATVSGIVAVVSLFLAAASLLAAPAGGVVFTPFLLGLFLLALLGVFGGLEDQRVRQHNPVLDGKRWRNGSQGTRNEAARMEPRGRVAGAGRRGRPCS